MYVILTAFQSCNSISGCCVHFGFQEPNRWQGCLLRWKEHSPVRVPQNFNLIQYEILSSLNLDTVVKFRMKNIFNPKNESQNLWALDLYYLFTWLS